VHLRKILGSFFVFSPPPLSHDRDVGEHVSRGARRRSSRSRPMPCFEPGDAR